MKVATVIARVLLGLMFVVFGLNIFLPFIPMPEQKPPPLAADFSKALFESHYLLVVGALQVIGGLLLLIGRFVPLGLVLLGPVIVNIVLFHLFLNPTGLLMAIIVATLALFLLWSYRAAFAGLVRP
jgi:putative oxidoreductase